MVEVVEHAGLPFRAAEVRTAVRWFGDPASKARVGPATVRWAFRPPDRVEVAHPAPAVLLDAMARGEPRQESYAVRVLRDETPTGGWRRGRAPGTPGGALT